MYNFYTSFGGLLVAFPTNTNICDFKARLHSVESLSASIVYFQAVFYKKPSGDVFSLMNAAIFRPTSIP
jgi:hypothetical protein